MGLAERFAREDADAAAQATFNDFWELYPRKVAKLEAMKAWKQMTREFSPDEIIAGLRANLNVLLRREKQFVKHPASWLRAGCWMDEPEPLSASRPQGIIGAAYDLLENGYGQGNQGHQPAFELAPPISRH